MKNEHLEICPYCRCKNVELIHNDYDQYYAECCHCEAHGPLEPSSELAVEEWNRVSKVFLILDDVFKLL